MTLATCVQCERAFEAQRSSARYCTRTCQQRAYRQRKAAEDNVAEVAKTDTPAEHDLVRAVRTELERAEALNTVQGQIALQLARRLVNPDASGLAALADKLTSAMAAATGSQAAPGPAQSQPPAEPDDEITRARAARAQAREAAGRS